MSENEVNSVTVLLSTYNGEKYLPVQLESILNQEKVNLKVLARDDGSSDNTINILNEWKSKLKLEWYCGENLKPAMSFWDLLVKAKESPYYAFSDQDDYWMPDKLSTAINALKEYDDVPALYFCQTQLADKNLNRIESVIIHPLLSFGEALVYEFIGGCTMVFNSKLRDLVVSSTPNFIPMHDVLIYNIAMAVGAKVIFDPIPHILYRQHESNVIGQSTQHLPEWKNRMLSFFKGRYNSRSNFAKEIYEGYNSYITSENIELLDLFIKSKQSFTKRIKLLFDNRYKCSNKKTFYLFKIAVIFNTY